MRTATRAFRFRGQARTATEGVQAFVDREGYRRRIAAEKAVFEKLVAHETQARAASSSNSLQGVENRPSFLSVVVGHDK